jgi:endonuclease/exonuclease/phosphatase (EEP) superfamily protein YafD
MLRRILAAASAGGCALLTTVYAIRPANADPVTIWPFWFWALPGLPLGILGFSRTTWRWSIVAVAGWILATSAIAEEPRALLRAAWRHHRAVPAGGGDSGALRVISVNCAGGNVAVVREALARDPDIVLLQESPTEKGMQQLFRDSSARDAAAPKWGVTQELDTAIAVRGSIEAMPVQKGERSFACVARVTPARLRKPTDIVVVSTHIVLPQLRGDLWRPSTWRGAAHSRAVRLRQMSRVAGHAVEWSGRAPTIAGGDFNTPAGDSLFRPLRPYVRDAFAEAGTGWPGTITNEFPWSRIDQVWVSDHFAVASARSVRTANSDHRMVVVDLVLRRAGTEPAPPR